MSPDTQLCIKGCSIQLFENKITYANLILLHSEQPNPVEFWPCSLWSFGRFECSRVKGT